MITKNVNGEDVPCTPEEEAAYLAYWEFNGKYPLYGDALTFDFSSMPVLDMVKAIEMHRKNLERFAKFEIPKVTVLIEAAQENGEDTTALLAKRKALREAKDMPLPYTNMDDLIASVPEDLKKYFVSLPS